MDISHRTDDQQEDLPKWKRVLLSQDWALVPLFLTGVIFVVIGVARTPVDRPIFADDAAIRYQYSEDSVHYIVAFMAPFGCLVGSILVVEFIVHRKSESTTAAIAATIHFLGTAITMFFTVIAITEVTKVYAGRLRPDFLDRCFPPTGYYGNNQNIGPGRFNEMKLAECIEPNKSKMDDGRQSFPSGHASSAMCVSMYNVMYLVWSLYFRNNSSALDGVYAKNTLKARCIAEFAAFFAYLWVLFQIALGWYIGASRFKDNRHHVSDIIAGFVLAIICVVPYFFRALAYFAYFKCSKLDRSPTTKLNASVASHGGNAFPAVPATPV
jgi:diacylglycerol diphosphate phosphatase/phosphatidate phosphatase